MGVWHVSVRVRLRFSCQPFSVHSRHHNQLCQLWAHFLSWTSEAEPPYAFQYLVISGNHGVSVFVCAFLSRHWPTIFSTLFRARILYAMLSSSSMHCSNMALLSLTESNCVLCVCVCVYTLFVCAVHNFIYIYIYSNNAEGWSRPFRFLILKSLTTTATTTHGDDDDDDSASNVFMRASALNERKKKGSIASMCISA